ncbi:MAG: hypothetical protein WA977_02080 [Halobacteriota archaeon]|jgi:ketopantoate reductase
MEAHHTVLDVSPSAILRTKKTKNVIRRYLAEIKKKVAPENEQLDLWIEKFKQ